MAVATTQEGMIFVAGEFRAPSGGATTDVVEKATGHVLSTVDTLSSQRHLLNHRLGTVDQVMAA